MRTRAVRDGDEWVINGEKNWITNLGIADFFVLFAVTDPDAGHSHGISAFVVESGWPGLSIGKLEHKMGIRGSPTGQPVFSDVRVPSENLIGDEGEGFKVAMATLDRSRLGVAAQAIGIAQGATDYAVSYAKERRQFGQPLLGFQGIQFKLADMEARCAAGRELLYKACAKADRGESDMGKSSAMAKLFCSDTAMAVTTEAVQVLGGYGYVKEYPVERMMRDAKITQIYEGTNAIQRELDDRIKATGHENFYFPLLMPASVLAREGELVEGFAPEVAVLTEAGGKKLEEPLAVRPTSEALIWSTYARWVQSYRDLPLLYNQWANVVRWELRPRLFLRTSEFLWQEGHTAHETEEEALAETLTILHDVYADTIENVLAIPVLRGRKSESERFPGAVDTYTLEALMRDGKALQAATSHDLGQNFARAFAVRYIGRDGSEQYPYATSWGATTRLVGGVVMAHGDDRGLRLPPRVAPRQVVIVPIFREDDRADVLQAAAAVDDELRAAGVRVRVDDRPEYRPGFNFNEWALKGVPLRIEIGGRDLASGCVTVARRDTGEKRQIPLPHVCTTINELLSDVQSSLYRRALDEQERRTLRDPT